MTGSPTQQELDRLFPWFQRITFPNGREVGTHPAATIIGELLSRYGIRGKTCLDIGCNAGVMCLAMEQAGAAGVFGVDINETVLQQAELVAQAFGLERTDFEACSVYGLDAGGRHNADFVSMCGVYYHLRHPLLGLERAWECCQEVMFIEGAVFPGDEPVATFVRGEYDGDASNWWYSTRKCMEDWLWSLGGVARVERLEPGYLGGTRCIWLIEREATP